MDYLVTNLGLVFFSLFGFAIFRQGIISYLRVKKNNRTYIKKSRKGFVNYWFYTKLHNEQNLGVWYYLNIVLTAYIPAFTFFVTLFYKADFMRIPIAVLSVILTALIIVGDFFGTKYSNILQYGRAFVLWEASHEKSPSSWKLVNKRRGYSTIIEIIALAFYVTLEFANLLMIFRSYGV